MQHMCSITKVMYTTATGQTTQRHICDVRTGLRYKCESTGILRRALCNTPTTQCAVSKSLYDLPRKLPLYAELRRLDP